MASAAAEADPPRLSCGGGVTLAEAAAAAARWRFDMVSWLTWSTSSNVSEAAAAAPRAHSASAGVDMPLSSHAEWRVE